MTFQFRPAKRAESKPLIGIYAESGKGKTYSALLLARGFIGPKGKLGMIETESGRGEAYADANEYPEIGGYEVLPLRGNFSPETYGKAITAAEDAKIDALIIDSASHEWEGDGGVLGMAAENQAAGKKGPLVWQKPKMDHQRHFMLRLMQTPIPLVIVCMRAKYPMVEKAKQGGGKEWVRSEILEPKQADDILFEMFVHGWIDEQHRFRATKYTTKSIADAIRDGEPISLQTGQRLSQWARGEQVASASPRIGSAAGQPAPSRGDTDHTAGSGADAAAGPDWEKRYTESEYVERWQTIVDAAKSAAMLAEQWNSSSEKLIRRERVDWDNEESAIATLKKMVGDKVAELKKPKEKV